MPLSTGDRLGPYAIVAPLGAGGMGEVYRARDTKLDREVAIKVLPEALALDPERLARFEREAKVLASLNHPHIAQIYGVEEWHGGRALVMELVPGETLIGPLPLETALDYARQIADALEAAHEKGIIHRDLKPANIMITPAGAVKVLDFGLAAVEPSPSNPGALTMTMAATQIGTIMGTAGYMSPEQAAAKPVDRRADIWSFGVVVYEMLAGDPMFSGETIPHTLADVLRAPIDLDKLPKDTPPTIRDLLRRCLIRDPRKRLRDIGDARIVIEEAQAGGPATQPAVIAPPPSTGRVAWAVAALLAAALAVLAWIHFRQPPPAAEVIRFHIAAPEIQGTPMSLGKDMALSPDGRRLAMTVFAPNGPPQLWIRSLDNLEARLLPGTEGAGSPFWSPDSRFIAFATMETLKKVDASGGPPMRICDLPTAFRGGAWSPDGSIIFCMSNRPMMRVADTGGAAAPITIQDAASPQKAQATNPVFLPGGRHFVYLLGSYFSGESSIYIGSLDAKPGQQSAKPLVPTDYLTSLTYAQSPGSRLGYVLFGRAGSIMALPFDPRRLAPAGAALPVAEGSSYSASSNGILTYRGGSAAATSRLFWFDRQGTQLGEVGPPGSFSNVQLSPDGKLVVTDTQNSRSYNHLWSADPSRGIFSRVNPGDGIDYAGEAVSPDGRVAFTSTQGGALGDLYIKQANGVGTAELLLKTPYMKHTNHWSLDGRYIVYTEQAAQQQDLWILPMTGDRKPIPFQVTPADETDANFSPDTRWIAYSSNESGRREVYVQGFVPDHVPAAGIGKWRISTAGGAKPRWRRDGKELFYLALDHKLMAVPVKSTASTFEPGVPVALFDTHAIGYAPYDVAADGRFLINTMTPDTANSPYITVVLNWAAALRK